MKKLTQLLMIFIGLLTFSPLTSRAALANPGTVYFHYSTGGGWTYNATVTKSADGKKYSAKVENLNNSSVYFGFTKNQAGQNADFNSVFTAQNNCYTCGDNAKENQSAQNAKPTNGQKLYLYTDCDHCMEVNGLTGTATFTIEFDGNNDYATLTWTTGTGGNTGGDEGQEETDTNPLYIIGDYYEANYWTHELKGNFSPSNADRLIWNKTYGYYIFTAQGGDTKFGLGRNKADWDAGWKSDALKLGNWTENNGIYSATISHAGVQSDLKAPVTADYVYYRINADQTTIECTTDITKFGGEIYTPPTIGEGLQFYVKGNFSAVPDTPFLMVPLGDGHYTTVIKCSNTVDGWKNMIFYSVDPDNLTEDGKPTVRYYGSNGSNLTPSNTGSYIFNDTNSATNYIPLSGFQVNAQDREGNDVLQTYSIIFYPTDVDAPNGKVQIYANNMSDTHKAYYLSGDINVWSDVTARNTSNETEGSRRHGFFSGENSNGDFFYMQDDPDNPWVRFKSVEEMESRWRFEWIGYGPDGSKGNWYRLNLKARGASDLNENVGRLGGQFKIIHVSLNSNDHSFGVNASGNADYWQKNIKLGVPFKGVKKGERNFMLDNTVVENAVIWFLAPDDNAAAGTQCEVIVLGEPHDLYMYYANDAIPADELDGFNGPKVYLNTSTQANNYPHTDPFREYDKDNNYVSAKVGDYYDYSWEKMEGGADYKPYGENGVSIHYKNVWRKKIPNSINHRTPMPFLTSVTPYDAWKTYNSNTHYNDMKWFPRVRIDCDDIWFVENGTTPINVFFRFADDAVQNSNATRVFFNAWLDQYDAAGSLMAPLYLIKNMHVNATADSEEINLGEMTKIDKNSPEWELVDRDQRDNGLEGENFKEYTWFMAPQNVITTDFANTGHAMFFTSYGGKYPTKLSGASVGDRQSVALNGADLYYVVGGSSSRVGILYSHLKGTVASDDKIDVLQIGAEFFAKNHSVYKDGDLNTTLGDEVDYQFSVLDQHDVELLGADSEKWFDEPYYNWEVGGNLEMGLYRVNVRVRKLVNGKYEIYSSNDIYPVFGPRNASAE